MRLHRFFINSSIEQTKILIKDERVIHQWRNVFRYNAGSQVIVFDGSGNEFEAVILKLTNREAEVEVVSKRKGVLPDKKIILVQSLIKKDKMEWVIEKATELGVSKIIPVVSERSEKKNLNIERVRKIIIEASEQCGRADVPEISQVVSLDEILKNCENIIVFDRDGEKMNYESRIMNCGGEKIIFDASGIPFPSHLDNSPPTPSLTLREGATPHSISIFIGPEGGWSEKELEVFKNKGAQVYSLGPLTFRAETAAVVALSRFM